MKLITYIWFFLVLVISGCNINVTNTQSIEIGTYSDTDKNVKLVEDLLYYDHQYLHHNIPSLNESTAKGIKLGYFIRSSDGKPFYRVIYNMKVLTVAKNIETLQSDFSTYIPKLAAFHASKSELFNKLAPIGQEWVSSLFSITSESILLNSSSSFRKSISADQLTAAIKNISSEFGTPTSTSFIRAQYYEKYEKFPEFVSLMYLQTFENEKKAYITVSFKEENGEWAVIGFRADSHT